MDYLQNHISEIITLITLAASGGLFLSVMKFIKSIKEVVKEVGESTSKDSDGGKVITDKEKDEILKDVIVALENGTNLWKLITGIARKKVKK